MTQVVAGIVGLLALATYGWFAVRLAVYPTPWALPWHIGSGHSSTVNAAVRFGVLAACVALVSWPYFGGGAAILGREFGLGFFPPPDRSIKADLTWLVIVLVAAGLIALALLIVYVVPALKNTQRTPESEALVVDDLLTLDELTDETLEAMMSERDPRRAILASYAQMERGLASRGIPRKPNETALEYMRRLLEAAGAPSNPLRSLTALFHIAGFSIQPMDESMRESAITALRAIRVDAR